MRTRAHPLLRFLIPAAFLGAALAGCGSGGEAAGPGPPADAASDPSPGSDTPAAADTGPAADRPAADTGPAPSDAPGDIPPAPSTAPVDLVDLFVGTGATGFNFGALQPGATTPFGMVRLSPDTAPSKGKGLGVIHAGGYFYADPTVLGFSHIHLAGTGVADYGNLLVTPQVGAPAEHIDSADYRLPLDHDREHAEPGYYRLSFSEPAMVAELTATARTGVHRYTFPATAEALLVIDVTHTLGTGSASESHVEVDAGTGGVEGFVHNVGDFSGRFGGFRLYFSMRPSRSPAGVGVFDGGGYREGGGSAEGVRSGAVLRFDTTTDPTVELRVGISFVDVDGARANLDSEAAGSSFDLLREAARARWVKALGVVEVEGGSDLRRRMLYTSLYRAQQMPTLLTDVDGRYRGLDAKVHQAEGFLYYSDLSLWDTYRTFHPLAVLLFADAQRDFLRSLLAMASDGGSLPRWPLATGYGRSMVGTSADVVIGDSAVKGLGGFDLAEAYAAMKQTATGAQPAGNPGRDGLGACLAHGYCPDDQVGGSVSKTLEYAHDDYCIARVAEILGYSDDAAAFMERSRSWRNLYDPASGFLAPRNADGSVAGFNPIGMTDSYVEGTPWHYLFMVPHDIPGLVELLGGPEAFEARLSTYMDEGRKRFNFKLPNAYYWHGNEPTLLAPFLFGFGGRADLSRFWSHWVADTWYALRPDGLAGNDDGGTLTSWYVFAAMGLYPLTCTGEYAHAAPLFDRMLLHMAGGTLEVRRLADPSAAPRWNGEPIAGPTLSHATLAGGGLLELPRPPSSDR